MPSESESSVVVPLPREASDPEPRATGDASPDTRMARLQRSTPALAATAVFVASAVFYGVCLFPGLGGELNAGDSAKFQILGHTPILVHGPGYPFVLLLGALLRAIELPFQPWWTLTFALAAVPAAVANALAFLIVHRVTHNLLVGLAGALLLGSAGLMAVQATEAEVYALNLAFILGTVFLLMLFAQTKRLGFFLAACAVYALSFGNHLMMIMLLPLFVWLTLTHRRIVLRPVPVAMVLLFIVIGAAQYLYLAYVAYSPDTAYSEYMPLPPPPIELIHYIMGTYFSDLYGSGLASTRNLEALVSTLRAAHPWISMPLIAAGIVLFVVGWRRRDAEWRGLALVYGAVLAFLPFMLWYGAYDIRAFHLPVLGPLLVAAVATLGWSLRGRPAILNVVAVALVMVGSVRVGQAGVLLSQREPIFPGLVQTIEAALAQSPVERPIVAMAYPLRTATLYHELRGEVPRTPTYRVRWRAIGEVRNQPTVGGIVIPSEGYQFIQWIEHHRPDMRCRTRKIDLPEGTPWPAYAFECHGGPAKQDDPDLMDVSAPASLARR